MSISVSLTDIGGGQVTVSYTSTTAPAGTSLHRANGFCNISWPGGGTTLTGNSGSVTVYVGYYTTVSATAAISYLHNADNSWDHDEASYGSVTTGGPPYVPPPAAPSTPVLSGTATYATGVVALTWTSVGYGYQIYRDGSYLTTVYSASYNDTPGGVGHTYYVVPFNSTSGGTTYGGQSNTVTTTFVPPAGVNMRIGGAWVRKPLPKPRYIKLADGTWKLT